MIFSNKVYRVFQEYLIDKFPKARLKMNFANNKLSDISDLQNLLLEMRHSSSDNGILGVSIGQRANIPTADTALITSRAV